MPTKKIATTKRIPVNKKTTRAESVPNTIPLMLYRRIALLFVVLVASALCVVLYLATMQAVIRVTTVPKNVVADFIVNTVDVAVEDGEIQGEIHSGTLGKSQTVVPVGETQKALDSEAMGVVTITNNLSTPQPLVATTRLLTPEGVLFRLRHGVTVPAKGTMDAEVYADKKGASGDIGPSTFTIPGLTEAKQTLVTASSNTAMSGGVTYISVLSQEEIDQAVKGLQDELLDDAKEMLRQQRTHVYQGEAFFTELREQKIDASAGDEVGSFTIELSVNVSGVFYDDEALKKITQRKLEEGLGQGQEFISFGDDEREVTVEQISSSADSASIHVHQVGHAISSRTSQALNVGRFVGMYEDDVRTLLIKEGVATDVDVQFFPFWVRTVPRLKDHIYLEIH